MRGEPPRKVYIHLVALILVWGLSWPVSKIGLQYIDPILFAAYRLATGFICIALFVLLTRGIKLPKREDVPIILSTALFKMAFFVMLLNVGLVYIGAGRAAIIVYSTPIWVTPIAIWFFKEQFTRKKAFGVICGAIGIVMILGPWELDFTNIQVLLGHGMLLAAAALWSFVILHMRYGGSSSPPVELVPWQLLLASVVGLIIAFCAPSTRATEWNPVLVSALFYNGVIATGYAYYASFFIAKSLPSITTSTSFLGVPLVGLLASSLVMGEVVTMPLFIGLILIIGGLVFITLGSRNRLS